MLLVGLLLGAGCAGPESAGAPGAPAFDGELALALVRDQVAFGPRVPGTPGHGAQLAWMLARLDTLAPEVVADTFAHVTVSGDSLTLVNVLARFVPQEGRRILLLTHWDTRPRSDAAADPSRRAIPIPGANDGASGAAVLLELARVFRAVPPPMGVDLLFVDGEDFGPDQEDMFLGSRRYAERLTAGARPLYGILLDMVGDADPLFPVEAYSAELAPIVVRKLWGTARRLGYGEAFPEGIGPRLGDDHLPLIQAGLPTVDVIDFSYGPGNAWWHTPEDTPDRLSASTLAMVGRVVAELLYSGG